MGEPVHWSTVWSGAIAKITGAITQILNLIFSTSPLPDLVDLLILLAILGLIVRGIWSAFWGKR